MPTLETWVYYAFGGVLAVSLLGYGVVSYYAEKQRRNQKRAEAWLKKHESVLLEIKRDLHSVGVQVKHRTSIQQAEARISKAIADLLTSVEHEEKLIAKAR